MGLKEFTESDVLSLIDYSKNIEQSKQPSDEILKNWKSDKNNKITESDEHKLSVVNIYEQPIILKNKEVGKIVIFKYTGVGGGWHIDILKLVEDKYFDNEEYYSFGPDGNQDFYYRIFFIGKGIFNTNKWEKYDNNSGIRLHTEYLDKTKSSDKDKNARGILKIVYDSKTNGRAGELLETLRRYSHFWNMYSTVRVFVADIHKLRYKPSKKIIERRIKERTNGKQKKR